MRDLHAVGGATLATSAAYHRGNWSKRASAVFRRIDHANIFIFIAGTYTPLALTLLHGRSRWTLLVLIWGIAMLGVVFRTVWIGAPRRLYTALYVAMGWAALGWLGQFWSSGGATVVLLLLAGGIIYSLGPWPTALNALDYRRVGSDFTRYSTPARSPRQRSTPSPSGCPCSVPRLRARRVSSRTPRCG